MRLVKSSDMAILAIISTMDWRLWDAKPMRKASQSPVRCLGSMSTPACGFRIAGLSGAMRGDRLSYNIIISSWA